jgi:predicted nucleic acid-binding protein
MTIVDTSALIDSLTGPKRSAAVLRSLIESGERLMLPTLVLYEWWRGPRAEEELKAQEALFPRDQALVFGDEEAAAAAGLYQRVARPRGRELDLAIAAHCLVRDAQLWTLNIRDFEGVPGLVMARPPVEG